jgi:Fe2+ transport system protein B
MMKSMQCMMAVVLGLGLVACAQAPKADIDAAKQALDDAQRAQASDYASEAWTAAKDADAKLQAELDVQNKKWAPLRSYEQSKQLAQQVKSEAERATQQATAGKEKAKAEAGDLIAQAKTAYQNAETALETAPRGKGTEADLASLKTDTASIDTQIQDAQRVYDGGDYLGAKTKAQAALDAANKIQSEIQEAKSRRRAA